MESLREEPRPYSGGGSDCKDREKEKETRATMIKGAFSKSGKAE